MGRRDIQLIVPKAYKTGFTDNILLTKVYSIYMRQKGSMESYLYQQYDNVEIKQLHISHVPIVMRSGVICMLSYSMTTILPNLAFIFLTICRLTSISQQYGN